MHLPIEGDIGIIGLAVMGQNLALNMNDKGFNVVVFNRTSHKTEKFMDSAAKNTKITPVYSIKEMIIRLKKPRCIMLMIKAGDIVDNLISKLIPLVTEGDIIIDGGNANFTDTERRIRMLKNKNIYYIGAGISGGEEGARFGPSIMPGGMIEGWTYIKTIFQEISAKAVDNSPCCEWIGKGGSGHFVKMVHNGIEYADMQLICESYQFMKNIFQIDNHSMGEIFNTWNQTHLKSYLIEITAKILQCKDKEGYILDRILDVANQKGTGKWTGINALNLNVSLNLITESVFSRFISNEKDLRLTAESIYSKKKFNKIEMTDNLLNDLQQALLFSKIISYTQGYMLMKEASQKYQWELNYSNIASIWREGCIIKSTFLENIKEAFNNNGKLKNLLFDSYFKKIIQSALPSIRRIIIKGVTNSIAMPAFSASLNFFDSITTCDSPANLLQAQRDYFGAHNYERIDRSRGIFFHTNWTNNHS